LSADTAQCENVDGPPLHLDQKVDFFLKRKFLKAALCSGLPIQCIGELLIHG
jgi:hypothetical protein